MDTAKAVVDKLDKKIEKIKSKERKASVGLSEINDLIESSKGTDKIKQEIKGELSKKFKKLQSVIDTSSSSISLLESCKKNLFLQVISKKQEINSKNMKTFQTIDICFMVDCTGSMALLIEEAKNTILNMINRMKEKFKHSNSIRMAFIGYRDVGDNDLRFEIFAFTDNIEELKMKITMISATGGADECEDINGAFQRVLQLKWENFQRLLFHVGDAPPHNKKYHNFSGDDYPLGGPEDVDFKEIFKEIKEKNIKYQFLKLNNTTDKMMEEFLILSNELIRKDCSQNNWSKSINLTNDNNFFNGQIELNDKSNFEKTVLDITFSSVLSSVSSSLSQSIDNKEGKKASLDSLQSHIIEKQEEQFFLNKSLIKDVDFWEINEKDDFWICLKNVEINSTKITENNNYSNQMKIRIRIHIQYNYSLQR